MTVTNVSAAAGSTNKVNSAESQYTLFGPAALQQSQTSQTFTVDIEPYFISAYNIGADDVITIHQVTGLGSGTESSIFAPVYKALTLNQNTTQVRIDFPGRYYCTHTGSSALGTFTVIAAPANMTVDSLSGLSQALGQIIATFGTTVVGVLPIVVTSSGFQYTVSASLATNSDIETGTSVITLIDPAVLNHIVNANHSTTSARLGVNSSVGSSGTAVGDTAVATGTAATAVGQGTTASNTNGIALGNGASSTAAGAEALGAAASATATDSLAVGHAATASQNGAAAFGHLASASGATSTAIGPSSAANGNASTAVGNVATATGTNSVAIGENSLASLTAGIAIGAGAQAQGNRAIAIGNGTSNSSHLGDDCIAIGTNAGELQVANTATDNIFIGDGATIPSPITPTSGNVIIGGQCQPSVSGAYNVVIGAEAGTGVPNVSRAVIIGGFAMVNTGAGNGTSAVALGFDAGNGAIHPGVFIGDSAGFEGTFQNTIVVNGPNNTPLVATQDNQIVLGSSTNTQLVTAGSIIQGGVISASDERLKMRVEAEWEALDKVMQLDPVTFKWDRQAIEEAGVPMNQDEYDKVQHGLIAQEVELIFPEFVENIDRGNGSYKFVRYERLIPVLLAALQELNFKVQALEGKVK